MWLNFHSFLYLGLLYNMYSQHRKITFSKTSIFNVLDLWCLKPVCRVPHRAGWSEASCRAEVQWQIQAEFIFICIEPLWGKINGIGSRAKPTAIFRMLLLTLLCDDNTIDLVQFNITVAFQFSVF